MIRRRFLIGSLLASVILGSVAQAQERETEIDTSLIQEMQLGNPDAAVTVIEYASFSCPACKNFHEGLFKQFKADYIDTGKINFLFRESYSSRIDLWASLVARCDSGEQFFGIVEIIFEKQAEWARLSDPVKISDQLRRIGLIAGQEQETIEQCMQDRQKAQNLVAWYQQNALEHEVKFTPSFVVISDETHKGIGFDEVTNLIDAATDG
ncbi:MAG: thioredoxin domain-containing protein [Aestuariivita sp.]|nr:thioredoxin domain-containing protein [Aestuariivita sp.]MCY4202369.1 thioredoxin domain-containing protein [Aestuariivita sp.]